MEGKKPMFGFSINWRIALYATLLNRGYEMVVSLNGAMVFDSTAWFVTGVRASTGTQCVPIISVFFSVKVVIPRSRASFRRA